MAQKCGECGSADTSTGLHEYTCLDCGAVSPYTAPVKSGKKNNPDGPSVYYGDKGYVYQGDK